MKALRWVVFACSLALSCEDVETNPELPAVPEQPAHADVALVRAREDERVADAVEQALSQRWPSIATVVHDTAHPLASTEDVLRERGLPDPEAGLPDGVFSTPAAHRRYFAGLLLGWMAEPAALTVAARVEAQRLGSLSAAHAELPDVDQRLAMDALARASSDRLHAFCRRLSALGVPCSGAVLEQGPITLKPRAALEPRALRDRHMVCPDQSPCCTTC